MTRLHEILAVEANTAAAATKVLDEALGTFTKKTDHFLEQVRNVEMYDVDRQNENSIETKKMVTTVNDKLKYVAGNLARYYDVIARKEASNQTATADLIVDGETLIESLPVTLLIGLETRLKKFREVLDVIPTLQPGLDWVTDDNRLGVYKLRVPQTRFKTEKVRESSVIVPATKEHPAQTETWSTDKPVGNILDHTWSGMLSPADKSELLGRCDKLMRAVMAARQRANQAEIVDLRIGDKIMKYLIG